MSLKLSSELTIIFMQEQPLSRGSIVVWEHCVQEFLLSASLSYLCWLANGRKL